MVQCHVRKDGEAIDIVPRKLNDYSYIIDKQPGMNVPVKIFADEALMEKMLKDRCICQGVHVATLPGIKGESIMMPDAHQGYGFSIGGVAALDAETGVISPGGVGFDINCLHPDSIVQMQYGTWMKIKDVEHNWNRVRFNFIDLDTHAYKDASLALFMKKKEAGVLYNISTGTGHSLKVTGDHPLYTQRGMVLAKDLSADDRLHVHAFGGVSYEAPSSDVLVTEEDVLAVLDRMHVPTGGNGRTKILNHLKKQDFLPLRYDSKAFPVLLKLLGAVFGDGVLYFSSSKGYLHLYGEEKDLQDLQQEMVSVGLSPGSISERDRDHEITTQYGTSSFSAREYRWQVSSNAFVALFAALGCPLGKKTIQEYNLPQWLHEAALWQKRLFLAGYFGAEMSTPETLNSYNFYQPTFSMSKLVTLEDNAVGFLQGLRSLLQDFNISTTEPTLVEGYRYDGMDGQTIGWRVQIHSNYENHLRFLEHVGFAYNRDKRKKAAWAASYLRVKEMTLQGRRDVRSTAKRLYTEESWPKQEIMTVLADGTTNQRFVERSMYSSTTEARVPSGFISYEDYCEKHAVGDDGLVWTSIADMRVEAYRGLVYDVTMNDKYHNFIANNVVVSNCGVRLMHTNLKREDVMEKIRPLLDTLFKHVPPGVGKKSHFRLSHEDFQQVLHIGARWAVDNGYGNEEDLANCEEHGTMPGALPAKVSDRAVKRGIGQLGTLGSGNHFLEIQYVAKIHDPETAKVFGIEEEGQVVVMIHCGSRGLGHQVCSDYLRKMEDTFPEIFEQLPEKDLAYAPVKSQVAQDYYGAMCAAANFAWTNRHMIGHQVRKSFEEVFGKDVELHTVYDVAHNIAKLEEHVFDGEKCKVYVHRKGATRAFGPKRSELPERYQETGQPIMLPGSMGTSSYVLVGTEGAMEQSFGSTAHGAGRTMSRHAARKLWRGEEVKNELEKRGIYVKAASWKGISEEAPLAYKDVDEVVEVSDKAGIGRIVAQLKPIGVVKG